MWILPILAATTFAVLFEPSMQQSCNYYSYTYYSYDYYYKSSYASTSYNTYNLCFN